MKWLFRLVILTLALAAIAAMVTRGRGFTARGNPWASEERMARAARRWATPGTVRGQTNPVPVNDEVLEFGLKHWADHCASCHGNDGSGDTKLGRNMYPPAPDMRGGATQAMSDGELFYVIERGIPLTGMPAWGTGTADGERASWELVRFIRHLPKLTPEDLARMETFNPKSQMDAEAAAAIDDFLSGGPKKIIR